MVDELVAVAASVASNCEPCLEHHVHVARELGLSDEEIAKAIQTARKVKETPARHILRVADELLGKGSDRTASTTTVSLPLVTEAASTLRLLARGDV